MKKNKIAVHDAKVEGDLDGIARQKPNNKTAGLKLKLMVFNMVDSTKVANKRVRKNDKLRIKNTRKIEREKSINVRRVEKAKAKNKTVYTHKIIPLKDSINPRMFLREWLKYKIGEPPVIFDSLLQEKGVEQFGIYLRKRGFYYAEVKDTVLFSDNRKAFAQFDLYPGERYFIDSVYLVGDNSIVKQEYKNFIKDNPEQALEKKPFDSDELDDYRGIVARHMRDHTLFGFSSSHITYLADTNKADMSVKLGIVFSDRLERSEVDKDSVVKIKHRITLVRNVYFHMADTTSYDGNFKAKMDELGLTIAENQFLRTLDTTIYQEILQPKSDEIDPKRVATFLFNGELGVHPALIELQNYLEKENYYKEYYLERSYTRLLQLGIFQAIKPVLEEVKGTKYIDVHYYLVLAKKKTFLFEPRFTNSNGFLGLQSQVSFTNKNLFKKGVKMTIELGGGFESQPPVFDKTVDGEIINKTARSFNTFEIGPSIKFDIPGLFPTKPTLFSKRQRPRTTLSLAYNYQNRPDFERHLVQGNWLYKFYSGKTQIFQVGLPGLSVIKIVNINKDPAFEQQLLNLGDLFLSNTYSKQFIWEDLRFTHEYNNKDADNKKSKSRFYNNLSINLAGNVASLVARIQKDTTDLGQRALWGIGYSQFVKADNDFIYSYPISKNQSVHVRALTGVGVPLKNSRTSLPYDYSFFGGGANDNRGWRARQLGPGSYKYYLDSNRTGTQIGDIRLHLSAEYRISMGDMFKAAVFFDAGNVWTMKEDPNRVGSNFSSNFYREIALSGGAGIRVDFDFFIVRVDVGLPLTNPAMPLGERWIFKSNDRPLFDAEVAAYKLANPNLPAPPRPFTPLIHFGIGYPF
ncbi:MAG: BamA/TamA family outer membrane protein [Bacteroidota bacterium]